MKRALSVLLLVALVACGSDDDSPTGTVSPTGGGSAGVSSGGNSPGGQAGQGGSPAGQGGAGGPCENECCTPSGQVTFYACDDPMPSQCDPALTPPACQGAAGGAGAGGSSGSSGQSGNAGGAPSGGQAGQAGAPSFCGGKQPAGCEATAFCNQDGHCGLADEGGTCEPRPQGCPEDCPGVCGCDGQKYCNACSAHALGISVSSNTSCLPAADCAGLAAALSPEFSLVGSCTAIVRLDYQTLAVLGYDVKCGKYAQVTESAARQEAKAKTGYGESSPLISGAQAEDEFIFYQAPSDVGDVAAVSRRSGLAVFGGSIIGDGQGDLSYPPGWHAPSDLGAGCVGPTLNQARGFDLRTGGALDAASVQAAVNKVQQTALPTAMGQAGYLFDTVVLLYPRAVLGFDPAKAEWIVLVNGGWLD